MTDKSVLKRLAIQSGAIPHDHDDGETYAGAEFLKEFAAAVIEDYKVSLVPVGKGKTLLYKMVDLSNSNPLTDTERKAITLSVMSVILDEEAPTSDLGMLLAKFERTIKDREDTIISLYSLPVSSQNELPLGETKC